MQKQPVTPLPVKPTEQDETLKRELRRREETAPVTEESAEPANEEREPASVSPNSTALGQERDPKQQERGPEDAGVPADPADHADIQGE